MNAQAKKKEELSKKDQLKALLDSMSAEERAEVAPEVKQALGIGKQAKKGPSDEQIEAALQDVMTVLLNHPGVTIGLLNRGTSKPPIYFNILDNTTWQAAGGKGKKKPDWAKNAPKIKDADAFNKLLASGLKGQALVDKAKEQGLVK